MKSLSKAAITGILLLLNFTCRKNDSCSVDQASQYEQSDWQIHTRVLIQTDCSLISSVKPIVGTLDSLTVPSCEYWVFESYETDSSQGNHPGISVIPVTDNTSGPVSNVHGIWQMKLKSGKFLVIETNSHVCPYSYNDKYRITKYR